MADELALLFQDHGQEILSFRALFRQFLGFVEIDRFSWLEDICNRIGQVHVQVAVIFWSELPDEQSIGFDHGRLFFNGYPYRA